MEFKSISQNDCDFDGIKLHNPTISELSNIFSHEEDFFFVLKILGTPLYEIFNTTIENVSEFQIFLALLLSGQQLEGFTVDKKRAIVDFLVLLFKDYKFNLNNSGIMFTKENSIFVLNDRNFVPFKETVSEMFATKDFLEGGNGDDFNPIDERAKAIADKIKQGREKAAEQNGQGHRKSLIENYISILSVGLRIPPTTLADLTFYNLIQIYKRYVAKVEWDLDIKQRLAGGEPQDSPDFWMKCY